MQNYNFVKNDVFVEKICKYALYESSEGLFCAPRKAANFCHPGSHAEGLSPVCSDHVDLQTLLMRKLVNIGHFLVNLLVDLHVSLLVDLYVRLLVDVHVSLHVQQHIISMAVVNFMITSTTITTFSYQN